VMDMYSQKLLIGLQEKNYYQSYGEWYSRVLTFTQMVGAAMMHSRYGYNHKKVRHTQNEFARPDGTHINGVESYWSWVKRRLTKFNGISKDRFAEYLIESEWRFNNRDNLRKRFRKLILLT